MFWRKDTLERIGRSINKKAPFPKYLNGTPSHVGVIRQLVINQVNRILQKKARKGLLVEGGFSKEHFLTELDDAQLVSHITYCQSIVEAGWDIIISQMGASGNVWRKLQQAYHQPKVILFTGTYQTGCGTGLAEMGPFYCPLDNKIYVDPVFYRTFPKKFSSKANDFLPLFVQGHEKVHHIQNLLGLAKAVQDLKYRLRNYPEKVNKIQQIMELQADYLLGVCLHHANKAKAFMQAEDISEAMEIAFAIGDDAIQRKQVGFHNTRSFTHGDGGQRALCFLKGLETGDWAYGFKMLSSGVIEKQVLHGDDNIPVMFFEPENGDSHSIEGDKADDIIIT